MNFGPETVYKRRDVGWVNPIGFTDISQVPPENVTSATAPWPPYRALIRTFSTVLMTPRYVGTPMNAKGLD
jgi:hypothetical protein